MQNQTIPALHGQGHRASYAVTYDAINSAAREISQVALNAHLRAECRRFDLAKVSFKLFTLVLDDSLLRGSHTAIYPNINALAVLCGTQREEIHRAIDELTSGRLVDVARKGREVRVRIDPLVENWTIREAVSSDESRAARFLVRADEGDRALQWLPGFEPVDLNLVVADERLMQAANRLDLRANDSSVRPTNSQGRAVDDSSDQPTDRREREFQNPSVEPTNFREVSVEPTNPSGPLRSLDSKISKTSKLILSAGSAVNSQGQEVRCVDAFHAHDDFNRWLKSVERQHPSNIWSGSARARAAQQGRGATWCDAYGAQWWRRWQEDPARFRAVWNDTLSAVREGRIKQSIGGHANNLWTAWGEPSGSRAATKATAESVAVEPVAPQSQAEPSARDSGTLAECLHGLRSAID